MIRAEVAIARLRAGARLVVEHKRADIATDRERYFLDPGEEVGARTYEKIKRDLMPRGDGMFGISQTFRFPS